MEDPYGATTWRFHRFSPLAAATSALLHAALIAAVLPELLPQQARMTERDIPVTFELPAPPEQAAGDLAQRLSPPEPPPPLSTSEFQDGASSPASEVPSEKSVPPVAAPPPVIERGPAKTARPAQQRPARQDKPRGAAPQPAAEEPSTNRQAQQDYLWQIIRKLSQYRFHEPSGEARDQGVVVTRLTLARDGRLLDVSLASSSGSPNLDRGVLDTIRSASPFAPFPPGMTVDRHTFTVPIGYARER